MPSPDKKQTRETTKVAEGFRATRDFTFMPGQKTSWNKAGLEKFRAGQSAKRIAEDKKQLSRMFSLAAKSPELKDALDWAETHGVEIIIDRTSRGVGGYYWAGSGVVALGAPAFVSDANLAGVATHEIRHAWQDHYGMIATAETKFSSYAIKNALIEADATAHQMLAQEQANAALRRETKAKQAAGEQPASLYPALEEASAKRKDAQLADRETFLWGAFKDWYVSLKPRSYGDAAVRLFGKRLGVPDVTPVNFNLEFKPDSVPVRTGIDFTRDEQLRRIGKGFRGRNYFNAASRDELARKMLSPALAAKFFNPSAKKPSTLVDEVRRRQLRLRHHKGHEVLIVLES